MKLFAVGLIITLKELRHELSQTIQSPRFVHVLGKDKYFQDANEQAQN